jgi:hypothetical protein
VRNSALDARTQPVAMTKIEHSHAPPCDFVLVCGADAAASSSNFFARRAHAVHELVIWKNQMCSIAYIKAALNVHTVGDQLIDFSEECFCIEDNAVSNRAPNAGMQNPARDLMQNERFFADVNRVARVCSTLVSNDPIGALG